MSIRKSGPQRKKLDPYVIRRYLIMATIVLVVGLTAFNIWLARSVKQDMVAKQTDIGGDFTMQNQHGETVKFSDTNGKLRLVFFGFTHCPDICPVSMLTLTNMMNTLGSKASQVKPVFITIDPERDTPAVMKEFLASFHPEILGLSGSKEETEKAAQAFKAYYSVQKDAGQGDDHSGHVQVDHSGFIYLMDRNGKYLAHFEHDVAEQKLLDALAPHLE